MLYTREVRMMTGIPLSVAEYRIAEFTKINSNELGRSLLNLASGKRINTPSDGIPEFFLSDKLKRESIAQNAILRNIEEGRAIVDIASLAGEQVFRGITDMKELIRRYYLDTATDDDKAELQAEFTSLKNTVTMTISSTYYDGIQIVSDNGGTPFRSIALENKGSSQQFDIAYSGSDIADVTSLTIGVTDETTESAAVEAELGKAGSYTAKTSGYLYGLNAHYNLTRTRIAVSGAKADEVVESDTGAEMVNSMNRSIRNESAMAMLAQANMYQGTVLRLIGW